MSRTASDFPGWYVEFQTNVLRQLPRPGVIDQKTADALGKSQGRLKEILNKALTSEARSDCFELIQTIEITVPTDYVHGTRLSSFKKQHAEKFYYYNDDITDKNFSKATTKLTPGQKFAVKIFRQIVSGRTTSEERMEFLRSQGAIFTGAQGASLVFEQKRDELPKDFAYVSFDEKEALWKDSDGHRRVPYLCRHSDGDWNFDLGYFGHDWDDDYCLLCFCDFPPEAD